MKAGSKGDSLYVRRECWIRSKVHLDHHSVLTAVKQHAVMVGEAGQSCSPAFPTLSITACC